MRGGPPDPEMERAASAKGSPKFQSCSKPHQDTQTAPERQEVFGPVPPNKFARDLARDQLRGRGAYATGHDVALSRAPGAIKRGPRLPSDVLVRGPPPTGQIRVWRSDDCQLPPNFRKKFHE
jgi:hypothetical protein